MSDYDDRFHAALAELEDAGVWRINANPPYIRGLRALGLKPRPPYYQSFWSTTIKFGFTFSLIWGAIMAIVIWVPEGQSLSAIIGYASLSGAIFGVSMGLRYQSARRSFNLTDWAKLPTQKGQQANA